MCGQAASRARVDAVMGIKHMAHSSFITGSMSAMFTRLISDDVSGEDKEVELSSLF